MTQLPATLVWSSTSLTEHLFVVRVRDREQWRACIAIWALIKAEEVTGYEQIRGESTTELLEQDQAGKRCISKIPAMDA